MYPKNPMKQSDGAKTRTTDAEQAEEGTAGTGDRKTEKALRKAADKAAKQAEKEAKKAEKKSAKQGAKKAQKKTEKKTEKAAGRRIQVRRSGVHGKGVFAVLPIAKGETIIEYTGERIDWPEALRRHPHDPSDPHHTFYFSVGDDHVLDALYGGNASRWINHSCDPNCVADENDEGRVFIKARRKLDPGEELFYDYGLVIDERYTRKLKKQYECRCGAKKCRGTMLSPKT